MDVSKEGKTSREAFSSRRAVPMGFNREERRKTEENSALSCNPGKPIVK